MNNDDEDESPRDPFLGSLVASAMSIHEMVMSFVEAGFARKEAIYITVELLKSANSMRGGSDDLD